jgi:hypothetical protein
MKPGIVKCPKCGEMDNSKFAKCAARKTGLQAYCKSCLNRMIDTTRKGVPPELRIPWNWRCRYHLTAERYNELLTKQGGVCGICKQPESTIMYGKAIRLAVDHDHSCCPEKKSCGKCIRGLLCSRCNKILAYWKDSVQLLQQAVCYLETPLSVNAVS